MLIQSGKILGRRYDCVRFEAPEAAYGVLCCQYDSCYRGVVRMHAFMHCKCGGLTAYWALSCRARTPDVVLYH
jgi:hypothetical protein